jgi:addiction module HigA family antidote
MKILEITKSLHGDCSTGFGIVIGCGLCQIEDDFYPLILWEFCIEPLCLTVTEAANAIGVTRKTLSALLNGRSRISPEMPMRLSSVFGRSPEGWLKLQLQFDLWRIQQSVDLKNLKRLKAA